MWWWTSWTMDKRDRDGHHRVVSLHRNAAQVKKSFNQLNILAVQWLKQKKTHLVLFPSCAKILRLTAVLTRLMAPLPITCMILSERNSLKSHGRNSLSCNTSPPDLLFRSSLKR